MSHGEPLSRDLASWAHDIRLESLPANVVAELARRGCGASSWWGDRYIHRGNSAPVRACDSRRRARKNGDIFRWAIASPTDT